MFSEFSVLCVRARDVLLLRQTKRAQMYSIAIQTQYMYCTFGEPVHGMTGRITPDAMSGYAAPPPSALRRATSE